MGSLNKVKLEICGSKYVINTSEEPEYVHGLAYEINDAIKTLLDKSDTMTYNDALVLVTLNYADLYKKSEESADNLREQLTGYLEDAARARIDCDEAHREIERLRRELAALKPKDASRG